MGSRATVQRGLHPTLARLAGTAGEAACAAHVFRCAGLGVRDAPELSVYGGRGWRSIVNLASLFQLLEAARGLCGHREYVVVGSLSVLGLAQVTDIPADMTMSIDADCYTATDPGRVFGLQAALGEGSPYHRSHGIYLDPVSPKLPTLPDGWEQRLIRIQQGEVTAAFLDPNDAAVSKLARGEPRDLRWVRAGLKVGIVSLAAVRLRMRSTAFLDAGEQQVALQALESLAPQKAGKSR